jgi:hypothetical protein
MRDPTPSKSAKWFGATFCRMRSSPAKLPYTTPTKTTPMKLRRDNVRSSARSWITSAAFALFLLIWIALLYRYGGGGANTANASQYHHLSFAPNAPLPTHTHAHARTPSVVNHHSSMLNSGGAGGGMGVDNANTRENVAMHSAGSDGASSGGSGSGSSGAVRDSASLIAPARSVIFSPEPTFISLVVDQILPQHLSPNPPAL